MTYLYYMQKSCVCIFSPIRSSVFEIFKNTGEVGEGDGRFTPSQTFSDLLRHVYCYTHILNILHLNNSLRDEPSI